MAIDPSDEPTAAYQKRYSRLLAVLQEKRGQWMTRQEIIDALGLSTFSSSLAVGMEALESVRLIETRRVASTGRRKRWEYRIKP
jgi:DNA-binding PadR family transcriptional regulator